MTYLVGGLFFGMLFGIFLQRGRIVQYGVQIGTLRFKDLTMVKFMFSAIIVGMIGVKLLHSNGLAPELILPTNLWPIITGGMVFGLGWALIGY